MSHDVREIARLRRCLVREQSMGSFGLARERILEDALRRIIGEYNEDSECVVIARAAFAAIDAMAIPTCSETGVIA